MADIARAAGVSKASLFHYFGSKKALYLYLTDFSVERISEALDRAASDMPEDFFDRIKRATLIKIEVINRYPGMLEFLYERANESDPEVFSDLKSRERQSLASGFGAFFAGVDLTRFKEGADLRMAMNAVLWIGEGFVRHLPRDAGADTAFRDISAYMDLLRQTFYKEGT